MTSLWRHLIVIVTTGVMVKSALTAGLPFTAGASHHSTPRSMIEKGYSGLSRYAADAPLLFWGSILIVVLICLLVLWRYKSIVHLNTALNLALDRQREVEEKLKDEQTHLRERIEERTRALSIANEKLQREMAEGKAKEASLKLSESQLKEAQKVARMGHWTLDLANNGLAWSDEIFRIFELDGHEFDASYEAFLDVVHPDDREKVDRAFKQAIKDRTPYDLVHRLLMGDGRIKWIHEKGLVHYDDNGNGLNAIGTVQDITVLKESEARFLREVSRTTFLLELHKVASDLTDEALYNFTLEYAVALTDSRIGYLHRVNEDQQSITLTAWNKGVQKQCKAMFDTHYPLDQAGIWANSMRLKRPVVHNDYQAYDAKFGYPEGHVPIVRHMSIPVVEGGKVRLVLGVGNKDKEYSRHDINMLQVIANELQVIIEHQQVEKEKNLMEMQLRQAQKMESIGTLAGGIAHDFNNILTIILGYSEIVRGSIPPDSHAMVDLDNVITAGNRAKDLVRQILTFSRQSENEFYPLKIHLILTEVLKFLRSSIPTTITIESSLEKDCGDVMADPIQIHQLVMNLCTNAFHAMREDGGLLKLSLTEVHLSKDDLGNKLDLTPGSYVRLSVSDTGKGMDHLTLSRIFDPYFTTKSKGEGTGLGLAIVHGIVQNIGGTITVYSEVGMGTTFHAYLPVTQPQEKADVHWGQKKIPRGKEHILIVDDEPMIARMLDKSLTDLGYKTTMHTNSTEALDHYRNAEEPFELVITDMTMPNMTGAELARNILAVHTDQAIILCTGFSELIDEEKAREIGFRAFLMKPIIKSDIAAIVRHVLDNTTADTARPS